MIGPYPSYPDDITGPCVTSKNFFCFSSSHVKYNQGIVKDEHNKRESKMASNLKLVIKLQYGG